MNVEAHIAYWRASAEEDLDVARELLEKGRYRHALFFAHLAIEKILKAHVTKTTGGIPPKIHNTIRLAELAQLAITPEQDDFLRRMNAYQLEGQYPDLTDFSGKLDAGYTAGLLTATQGFLECLKNLL